MAATTTRPRPRSLPSTTTKLSTELGNLYVTICLDDDGHPFEVFGSLGKAGSLQHGVTELPAGWCPCTCAGAHPSRKSWTSARAYPRCSPGPT